VPGASVISAVTCHFVFGASVPSTLALLFGVVAGVVVILGTAVFAEIGETIRTWIREHHAAERISMGEERRTSVDDHALIESGPIEGADADNPHNAAGKGDTTQGEGSTPTSSSLMAVPHPAGGGRRARRRNRVGQGQ
jgi:hypothetical protein